MAELRRTLEAEETALQDMRRAVAQQLLATQRATGAPVENSTVIAATLDTPPGVMPQGRAGAQPLTQGPNGEVQKAAVAPIFEETGVLTAKGHFVLEPSVQYSYSSNNRVTLLGYTILPALVVGLVDVREVKRNTVAGALSARYGLTNKLEIEARAPYIYRSDSTRSRPYGAGSPDDTTVNASGRGVGDVELAARYQLTNGTGSLPIMIGSLRAKSRTGTDPFEVVSDCSQRCVGNATGTGQPLELPTGSGFYSLQPGLTWLFASVDHDGTREFLDDLVVQLGRQRNNDVQALAAAGLEPGLEPELFQHRPGQQGRLLDVRLGHAPPRVQVEDDAVGRIDPLGRRVPGVEFHDVELRRADEAFLRVDGQE